MVIRFCIISEQAHCVQSSYYLDLSLEMDVKKLSPSLSNSTSWLSSSVRLLMWRFVLYIWLKLIYSIALKFLLTIVQDRTPGEPFVPKSSKEAEMEKILKSMEVIISSLLYNVCLLYMLDLAFMSGLNSEMSCE